MSTRKFSGFTLSEVLLVLSVIGIVAALTIPTLVQKVNDDQYSARLKKIYSTLSQSVGLMQSNGDGIWDSANATTKDANMRNAFTKYLNAIKTDTASNIFYTGAYYNKYKGGASGSTFVSDTSPTLVTSSGEAVRFNSYTNCNGTIYGGYANCGYITIDINAKNAPNMFGKDLFGLWVFKVSNEALLISPWGGIDGENCVTGSGTNGCTAAALLGTLP